MLLLGAIFLAVAVSASPRVSVVSGLLVLFGAVFVGLWASGRRRTSTAENDATRHHDWEALVLAAALLFSLVVLVPFFLLVWWRNGLYLVYDPSSYTSTVLVGMGLVALGLLWRGSLPKPAEVH